MSLSVLSKRNVPVVPGSGEQVVERPVVVLTLSMLRPGPTRWAIDFTVNKPGFLTGIVSEIDIDSLSAGKINRVPPPPLLPAIPPPPAAIKRQKSRRQSVPRISHNEVQMSRWHSLTRLHIAINRSQLRIKS